MSLASRITRVQYAKVESAWGTPPGDTGFRTLRRTRFNVNPRKDRYDTNEVRQDQQRSHARFGGFRVEGTLEGELSCGSYQPEFQALLRASATAVSTLTGLTITVAGSGPTYTYTRGSGSYITDGVRVGMVVRWTLNLNAGTLNRNIYVTALSATVLTGYALDGQSVTTEGPTSTVSLAVPGKRIVFPSTGHTEVSFYYEDVLKSNLMRRMAGIELNTFAANLAPNQVATFSMGLLGKDSTTETSQYATSPTAATTVPVLDGVLAAIIHDGAVVGIMDQLSINTSGGLTTKPVIGTRATPAIFQGVFVGNGSLRSFVEDATWLDHFDDEDEFEIAAVMFETSAANSDFMAFHLPSCKVGQADVDDNDPPQITVPFDFRKKEAATGYDSTSFSVQDSRYT